MVKTLHIRWKNVYHMLCYTPEELRYLIESDVDIEDVNGVNELLARLLLNSLRDLKNRGVLREYEQKTIVTDKPCGSIDIKKSYNMQTIPSGKLCCVYDELDTNNKYNQIIKAATFIMYNCNNESLDKIKDETISELDYELREMNNIDNIDIDIDIFNTIDWNNIPVTYQSSLVICKLIIQDWLACDKYGKNRLFNLANTDRLKYIFENFVKNYYNSEYKTAKTTMNKTYRIPSEKGTTRYQVLDMLLETEDTALIIDTKWYDRSTNSVGNENQVSLYGQSYLRENEGNGKSIVTLLLYADSETIKDTGWVYLDANKKIKTFTERLDINQEFENIKLSLNNLADRYLKQQE